MKLTGHIAILFFLLISCKKDNEGRIPDVYVNFRAPLSDPRINKLNSPGSAVVIDGHGVAGLIIYRRPDSYVAFDRCSTVNPERKCAVTPDDPNLTATDPCSGAKFSLYDGAPMNAQAKRLLKQYQVIITSFEIQVTN